MRLRVDWSGVDSDSEYSMIKLEIQMLEGGLR